jgi:hypothetical protein
MQSIRIYLKTPLKLSVKCKKKVGLILFFFLNMFPKCRNNTKEAQNNISARKRREDAPSLVV